MLGSTASPWSTRMGRLGAYVALKKRWAVVFTVDKKARQKEAQGKMLARSDLVQAKLEAFFEGSRNVFNCPNAIAAVFAPSR